MARRARTVPLKVIRISLDPLDPVEARVLRRLDEIGRELVQNIAGEFEMSQDEIDRYALKRLLADALVYESNGARSVFASEGQGAVVTGQPATLAAAAPAAVQPVMQEVAPAVAPAEPVTTPPAVEVQPQPEVARQDAIAPVPEPQAETAQPAAQAPAGSWQEQLINESSKPGGVSPLLQGLSWPGEDD